GGIGDWSVTGVQTCALPISHALHGAGRRGGVAVARRGRPLCLALLWNRVGLRARSVGPARRVLVRRAAGLLSDLRFPFLGDSSGGGSIDAGPAPGRGMDGVPAA